MHRARAGRVLAAAVLAALAGGGAAAAAAQDAALAARIAGTCSVCHTLPPADALPRSKWPGVIRDMAALMAAGIGLPPGAPAPSLDFDVEQLSYFFERRAPVMLPSPDPWPEVDAAGFARHVLTLPSATGPAATANVRFLPLGEGGRTEVVAADMLAGVVLAASPTGTAARVLGRVPHPCHVEAVDLDRDGRLDLLVADLGEAVPGDSTEGAVVWLQGQKDGSFRAAALASRLPRVADVEAADFDGDGDLDLVVAAFGWRKVGGILLFENRTGDWTQPSFVAREIDARTGAIHVPVADLDGDGHLDFVALLAQQHEAVVAFLGDGKGGFRKHTLDQAPHPAWGSSGLQLVDMDGDRDLDVLVTNGDMLDDFTLKPYHGLRWLENAGGLRFVPHDLAPLFGVLRAQAADLDGDGDMDVVAGAMVQLPRTEGVSARAPDLPSLVWLEQTQPGRFLRHTLERGRPHLSLDLADYDGDGDVDIVTATSLSGTEGFAEVWENQRRRR
jgi:hypothetical protein